jgi:hypothetical protein
MTYSKSDLAFLRELADALDELPTRELIAWAFHQGKSVCALGAIAAARGLAKRGGRPYSWIP